MPSTFMLIAANSGPYWVEPYWSLNCSNPTCTVCNWSFVVKVSAISKSFQMLKNWTSAIVMMELRIIGTAIRQNAPIGVAPSTVADSRISRGTDRKYAAIRKTVNGNPITVYVMMSGNNVLVRPILKYAV